MGVVPILGFFDDLAEAIADPPVNRPIDRSIGNFGRTVCNRISAVPSGFAIGPARAMFDVCGPYWAQQGYDAPSEEQPFVGGQCPVAYSIPVGQRTGGELGVSGFIGGVIGPISSISIAIADSGQFPNTLLGTVTVVAANGTFIRNQQGNETNYPAFGDPIRGDGAADNCGDPPPIFLPGPNPAPDPGPLPPGTGPQINIRGNPIFVFPPRLEFSPDVTLGVETGDISFGGGGGGLGDDQPISSPEEPGPNDGAGGADDGFGLPPAGERWIGCCIRIVTKPTGFGSIPGSEPYDAFPTVFGNARLLFDDGGVAGVDTPMQIRSKHVCLWEPAIGLRPTGVYVNLNPNFTYIRTPYSVPEA